MNRKTLSPKLARQRLIALLVASLLAVSALALAPSSAYADEPLPAPTKVKAKATKKCAVKLSWSKVEGARGYTIYRSTSKAKGFKPVWYVRDDSATITMTDDSAPAGTRCYYKIAAYGDDLEDGNLSKRVSAKVGSTFKNSYVKFTIPKYWRGKVYIKEDTGSKYFKSVAIKDVKTGAELASLQWSRRYEGNDGDFLTHAVKHWKRGKGEVALWVNVWPQSLFYSKYVYHTGTPTVYSFEDDSSHKLTKSEINRLIKLQTGGKLNYKKIKKVAVSKSGKYTSIPDNYIKKHLKVKIVK